MLVLTLIQDGDQFIRITTRTGEVIEINLVEVRNGEAARLGLTAPRDFPIERISMKTGMPYGKPRPLSDNALHSLSDGVAEATLACTGACSSAPMPRTEAGEAPLVRVDLPKVDCRGMQAFTKAMFSAVGAPPLVVRGQGEYTRATSGRDVARDSALGGLINAIA